MAIALDDGKIALARAVGALSRRSGRGGTSLPGKVLMRLDGDAVARLSARLPRGSALISATNGKTTTATMTARVLEAAGVPLVHNRAGANMGGGIASTLLEAARTGGRIDGELGLFEVDEFWLERMVAQLRPRHLLLGNLFRDQLDRYGELETIADRWAELLRSPAGAGVRLIANADDPLVADLGRELDDVVYFGVEDERLALPGLAHAADATHCRRCGAPYRFDVVYLGHLGHYHCPNCGATRPAPMVAAHDVELQGTTGARFTLRTGAGSASVTLALPGLYNVYNATAAAALATALEIPLDTIVAGLQATEAAFGRAETLSLSGRPVRILLIKNPVGANEVLRTLTLEPGELDVFGVLNDNIADGRDVSWVWDADFEALGPRIRRVTCAGTRAAELALRLKYAGVPPERIVVHEDLEAGLNAAVADRPEADTTLYALPTYTAMLALRDLLAARGVVRSSWA
jgi:UDP-N-acetylmuramyl tripeptide synthase